MRLACRALTMDSMPPTWTMATSFSGTSPKWRSARRAPTSIDVPKRVIPKALPLSCSGLSISGRAIKLCTSESSVVPTTMTSAPPSAALAVVPPEICKNCTSPATKAFIPATPVGVAMPSTSKPCLVKIPAARAIQGGHITEDSDVKAIRTLRGADDSAASEELDVQLSTLRARTRQASLPKFKSLPSVKPFGVFAQYPRFRLSGDVGAAANGRNDVREDAVPVRIVRSKENLVVANSLDHIRNRLFLGLHGKEPVAMLYIFTRLFLTQRRFDFAALFPLLVHPLHPVWDPTGAALQKRDAQLGKSFGDTAIDETGKLNKRLDRPADGVHENKAIEADFSGRPFAPVMNA